MEDVLEVYHRPYDADFPVVCMDEQPVELTKETRTPLPMEPGQPKCVDYEYERNGTACIFMFNEPKIAKRTVSAHEQGTMTDWAHQIKHMNGGTVPTRNKSHADLRQPEHAQTCRSLQGL